MATDLHTITIAEAGRAFANRALSPVELTRAYLERIDALDGTLFSYIEVTAGRALAEAKTAEGEIMGGRHRGGMHGIPYGLKDIYETAGLRTTAHSRLLIDHVPEQDCAVQAKLREAGGVLLGKQATWEFAYGGPSFDLPWPPARNPWDLSRWPMGSSSGSAAAVAAGLCAGAMGSDTGGSIRIPATVCGVAGLKPTYGRISRRGVLPNSFSFDHCGPMAWTVEDCAILLQTVAGYDPRDPGSADVPVDDYVGTLQRTPKGLRVGLVAHWYEDEVEAAPDILAAMDETVRVLADLGCSVRRVGLPTLRDFTDCKTPLSLPEIYAIHEADLKRRPQTFGHNLRYRLMPGALVRAEHLVQAARWRTELTAQVLSVMDEVDVLVTAGSATSAPALVDEPPSVLGAKVPSLTTPFNLTGQPALALCNGFDVDGLPVGFQIAGRLFDEATVLALGHAFEMATGHRARRPPIEMLTAEALGAVAAE